MGTSAVNAVQALLLLVAGWTFARRARVLLFHGRLDRTAFVSALHESLRADQLGLARGLAQACLPAWPARIALTGLDALESRGDVQAALEEQRLEFAHAAPAEIASLRALARMAPPLAFIGIFVEVGRALSGGYGLAALQRGLPARLALERGLTTFALGVGTTVLAVLAVRVLRRGVTELVRGVADVSRAIENAAQVSRSYSDVGSAEGAPRWT